MTSAVLALDAVSKRLYGRTVLRDLSFAVPEGAITALLGPNGAGKTTTVSLIAGLRSPDAGTVRVLGADVRRRRTRASLSLVPQEIRFPETVTVRQYLDFVSCHRPPGPLSPVLSDVCERLGITRLLSRRSGGLSGGERRKLALALGFVNAPALLVLDEATTNLDEQSRHATWTLLEEYAQRGGAAVVTSHILTDIDQHAHRVVVMRAGHPAVVGAMDEVRRAVGGSQVILDVANDLREQVLARVRERDLGVWQSTTPDGLCWHTAEPLRLLQQVSDLTRSDTRVTVQPIPLMRVLEQLDEARHDVIPERA